MPCRFEFAVVLVDIRDVLTLDSLFKTVQSGLYRAFLVGRDLVAVLFQVLFGLEAHGVCIVDLVDPFLFCVVGSLVGLGLVTHPLDLVFAQS